MGNVHPRSWGWYMGASNFTGALGDFLAANVDNNLGGGKTGVVTADTAVKGKHEQSCAFKNHRARREDIYGVLLDVLQVARGIDLEQDPKG